jgi:hypothetical protein
MNSMQITDVSRNDKNGEGRSGTCTHQSGKFSLTSKQDNIWGRPYQNQVRLLKMPHSMLIFILAIHRDPSTSLMQKRS